MRAISVLFTVLASFSLLRRVSHTDEIASPGTVLSSFPSPGTLRDQESAYPVKLKKKGGLPGSIADVGVSHHTVDTTVDFITDLSIVMWDGVLFAIEYTIWPWPSVNVTAVKVHLFDEVQQLAQDVSEYVNDISHELPWLHSSFEAVQSTSHYVFERIGAFVSTAELKANQTFKDFLDQYPEHRLFFEGRRPLIVLLSCVLLSFVVICEVFMLFKMVYRVVKTCVWGVSWIICLPCNCCKLRRWHARTEAKPPSQPLGERSKKWRARSGRLVDERKAC